MEGIEEKKEIFQPNDLLPAQDLDDESQPISEEEISEEYNPVEEKFEVYSESKGRNDVKHSQPILSQSLNESPAKQSSRREIEVD